jgi:hypothetical protein
MSAADQLAGCAGVIARESEIKHPRSALFREQA